MEPVRLQKEPLELAELYSTLGSDPATGGNVTFIGQVKGNTERGPVERLDITTDEGMALYQMVQLREEALRRFELQEAVMVHRFGMLEVGENIVFIGTSAVHRHQAYEANRWLLEQLKLKVPFWKAEYGPEGKRWVVPQDHVPSPQPNSTLTQEVA